MQHVLVTGAGGPAAYSFMEAVERTGEVRLFAADIDPHAAGLYLVPEDRRFLIPRGDDPDYVDALLALCEAHRIEVLVPTVDNELLPVANAEARFAQLGTKVLVARPETLRMCLDKHVLMEACQRTVPTPRSAVFDERFDPATWAFPVLLKPRTGSGGRGIMVCQTPADLAQLARDPGLLVQEFLPGAEYSVDVFATATGKVLTAVPRERLKVDSGVAVTSRTRHDPELERLGAEVARRIGLRYVANVQFRRDAEGTPRLMEVNPRYPGTMPLTVAAGADMPVWGLQAVSGGALPDRVPPFREVAIVRTWSETLVSIEELTRQQEQAKRPRSVRPVAA